MQGEIARVISKCKMGLRGLTTPMVCGICTFAVFLLVSRPFLSKREADLKLRA